LQTGRRVAQLMAEAGVPAGVFAPVFGDGAGAGAALAAQPLDGLYFTGSSATGRRLASGLFSPEALARRAASRPSATFPRLQLELGGKDPAYVRADVANPREVKGARKARTHSTHSTHSNQMRGECTAHTTHAPS